MLGLNMEGTGAVQESMRGSGWPFRYFVHCTG